MRRISFAIAVILAQPLYAQELAPPTPGDLSAVSPTIACIAALEDRRDPKCFATANRLEDFMFGTPLSESARFTKIDLQKELILVAWRIADAEARAAGLESVNAATLTPVLQSILPMERLENQDWKLAPASGDAMTLTERDVRQYGNVAYALRAVLAVQQERLFLFAEDLLPLTDDAVAAFKEFLDVYTLAALQIADQASRAANHREVQVESLVSAWGSIGHAQSAAPRAVASAPSPTAVLASDPHALTREIIRQKIASFEAYNQISMPVFTRNIQVYFARHRWPVDPEASDTLKALLTEMMIDFSGELIAGAEAVAAERGHTIITVQDTADFVHAFIPHRLNEFEDATFFPALPRSEQIYIEAYDMDAFRDGGLHWRYLDAAIGEPDYTARIAPDPFALELITENIAQFGVLLMRVAGMVGMESGETALTPADFTAAFTIIQDRIQRNAAAARQETPQGALASTPTSNESPAEGAFFADHSAASGIDFEHRSADWLNRHIRSYAIRDGEVAVLAVPPAFGGSGAASEDLNGDGHPDLLLLSGSGNALYLNNGDGTFRDVTAASGIAWTRPDGTHGEPRQPIIADFDNDGIQDIFISYANDAHRLYRGLGDARFEDATAAAGLGGEGLIGGPATAFDYDRDGLLDLYIGYFGRYTEGILPTLARVNTNGLPNKLFRNTGGMRFEDVTETAGVAGHGWTQAVGHTDFNGDGWQDLIEGNDFGTNPWYRNNGDGTFTDVSFDLGTDKPSYTMNVGIGDLNDDLLPDIYISNIVTMDKDQKYVNPSDAVRMKFDPKTMATMRVVEANDLFVSVAENGVLKSYVQSENIDRGRAVTGWSWGADFFDFDNDGDDDLYVANGMNEFAVYSTENPYYRDPEGNERDVAFPQSSRERNVLFVNDGGMLQYAPERSGADLLGNTRAVVYADIDGDGDQDMILNNYHEPAVVYRNTSDANGNRWVRVRLIGDPAQKSSADAIGAVIVATTPDGNRVWREIHGGSGYLTMHPKEQHLGVGQNDTVDLEIRWPGGGTSRFEDVEAGKRHRITQSSGEIVEID